jgi:hypothetical protein
VDGAWCGEQRREELLRLAGTEDYAPQLAWYVRVLQRALGKPLLGAFVHLTVRGEMAEVELGTPRA